MKLLKVLQAFRKIFMVRVLTPKVSKRLKNIHGRVLTPKVSKRLEKIFLRVLTQKVSKRLEKYSWSES